MYKILTINYIISTMKKLTKPHLILSFLLAFLTATPMFAQTLIGGTEFEPKDGTSRSFFIKDEQPPSGMFPSGANNNSNLEFIGTSSSQDIKVFKNTDTNTFPSRDKYDASHNTYLPSDNASKTLYNSKYVCTNEAWECGDNAGSSFNTIEEERYVFLANTREDEQNAIIEYKISDLTPGSKITVKASLNDYSKSTSYDGLRVRMILLEEGKETYSYGIYSNNNGYIKNNSSYIEYVISNYTVKTEEVTVLLVEDHSKANGVLMLDYIKVFLDYEPEPLPDPLPDGITCDPDHTERLFFEDFGVLTSDNARKKDSYIENNTSYNFVGQGGPIKSGGDYAVVSNPMWSGCTSISSNTDYGNTDYCDANNSDCRLWYRNITDHTGNTLGGMVQFDCKGGDNDILYQRTINNVCANTLVNFSAYITKANVSDVDPISARFLLRQGGADGKIIGRKDVENINLNDLTLDNGWKHVSAMFNTVDLNADGQITVQLINLASYGQDGNDILLDDLELTICTPNASMHANVGGQKVTSVENLCDIDDATVELQAEVEAVAFTHTYYLWQKSTDNGVTWTSMDDKSGFDKATINVEVSSTPTLYRTVVANDSAAADAGAANIDKGLCGLYAITNTVAVKCKQIEITITPTDDEICTGDRGELTVTVTNPFSYDITDLVVMCEFPAGLSLDRQHTNSHGTVVMPSYQWKFDAANPLPAGKTATLVVNAISTETQDIVAYAYLEKFNQYSYGKREDSPLVESSTIWVMYADAKAAVSATSYCEGDDVTFTSTVDTKCTTGQQNYQWMRRKAGSLGEYETITGATNATYTLAGVTADDATYEYAVKYSRQGCACNETISEPVTFNLTTKTTTPTAVTDYFECAETGTLTLSSLVNVEKPANLVFYDGETSLTTVTSVSKSDTSIDKYYYFTYKEDEKCVSDRGKVHVKIIPVPTASITSGASQTKCAAEKYTFTISATATNGTGVWKVTSGSAEIDNENSASTTACVLAGKTATLTWTVSNEKCDATASTTLSVDEQPKVTLLDGKGSASICGKSEFTVGVNTTASSGTWSIVEGSASIQSPNDKETLVTGVEAGKTVKLKYTATNGTCGPVDSELVELTNLVCNQFVLDNKFANETIGKGICLNQQTTLTVTITNSSMATSTNVKTSVKLPAGLTYVTHSGIGTYNNETGLWLIPSLETGVDKKAQLVITVEGTTAATHTVTATITEATGTLVSGMSIPTSITVHALPTAAFDAAQSTICIDEQDNELTNIKVNFTGAAPFELTYQDAKGSTYVENNLQASAVLLNQSLDGDESYTLKSVTDANGCTSTVTGKTHQVATQTHASLGALTTPPAVCEGSALELTAPAVTNNKGAVVTNPTWFLDGKAFNPATTVTNAQHNAKPLYYQITSSCNGKVRDIATTPAVKVTVDAQPVAFAGTDQTKCNNDAFVMSATVPEVGSGKWSVISGTANIQEPTSATTGVVGVPVNESATLQWTVSNGVCEANNSTVVLTNNDCTKLNLTTGTAPVVCDGNEATFTFTLTNGSGVTTTDVTSVITLGAGLSDAIITTNNGTISGNTWTVASMAPGDESVLTVVANATTADASVQVIVLTASGVSVAAVSATQSATVNALPSAVFSVPSSEVCADANELTNAQVTFTGASAFDLTYQVNGGANITKTGLTSPYIIKEPLTANGTLQLVSVKDAKGCVGTITGQTHSVTADFYPTIQEIVKPGTICEGNALSLIVPTVQDNGSTLGTAGWELNGAEFNPSSSLSATQNGQELKYAVAYTCGRQSLSTAYSNGVSISVHAKPSAAIAGDNQTKCNNDAFVMAATAPSVGTGLWTVVDGGTANIQEPTSATTGVVGVPVNESATLQWTVSNGVCEANNSTVVLTNNDCTKLNLTTGTAPVVCDGNEATFTFTLTNGSGVTTTDVTSVITLGAGLSDAIITTNNGTISGNTWTVASMAPGDESVLTVVANATTADASVQVIVLTASGVSVAAVSANQSATVNALPSAAFDITSSTICIDEQDKELTNIKVNFTGAPNFNLTYKVNNGADITKTNLSSPYSIKEQLSDDATISLVSVTDAKGCTGTITNQSHTVTTQTHASLGVLTAPEGVCDGGVLTLTAPDVTNNKGALVTNPKWFLDGQEFDPTTSVTHDEHNGKPLYYQITSSCNGNERNITTTPAVNVTVYATPQLSVTYTDPKGNVVTATQISCAIPYLTATLSGAETYTWTDGSTQNPRQLGKKGQTTTYQVTGVTAQNCTSEPLTITVTEDFVTPDVAIAVSDADKKITCSVTEITLTASSNTAGVTYKWDDADETAGAIVKVATPNTYKVTATNSSNGCSATATETIGINTEKPVIVITSTDANGTATSTLNCTAEASALTLVPSVTNVNSIGGPVTFVWDGDNTIPTERTVNEAKRYTVAATGANGCAASQFIDITLDDDVPTLTLTASAADITCLVQSSVLTAQATPSAGVTYAWNTNESGSQITVNAGGTYEVVATAVNGCTVTKSVTIDQHTDLPNVTISSTDPKQYCRVNTLTASGADKYVWSSNQTTTSIEVSEGGLYWVEGTNAYGCSARAELNLENDKETPVVAISSDINAITCTNTTATLTATITNADDARTYSYQWSPKSGTNSTLRVTEGKTYKVVVTDGTNYRKGEKTIAVAQHTEKPMVDVQTLPAVCLPATIDLAQAIGPNTLADNVVFFEDEALTQEITNTTIDLAQYKVFYVQGQQVNGNGCMGDAQPVAANVKAVTPAPVVKDYDECTKAGSEKFSSLVTSGYYKLNFYASENDEAPIADAFDASASNTTTTYYVSNTNQGACESERVPFSVHIEGLVDFEMEVSETEIMIGDDPVTITLIPSSVDVEGYRWMANGKELQVEGDEYTVPVYVDTKFEIAASGRCNSLTQEASVVVNWPTAFTPYNNNGMNETFAKGLPVLIFNRFGVQVFEGADGWDGVMNKNMGANVMAVPGVYYYAVSLPDGNVKKGTIEIVKF